MYKNNTAHCGLLLLTAVIWGSSFVAQSAGMEKAIGPFAYNTIRLFIGSLVLIPVLCFQLRKKAEGDSSCDTGTGGSRDLINTGGLRITGIAGIVCGCILAAASNLQQVAMLDVSAGKAGFLTALYIVLVPVIGIFFKKKTSVMTWLGVLTAVIGLYFLCIGRGADFRLEASDILLLGCALVFAFHIIAVDHFNDKGANGVGVACIQFFTAAVISLPGMLLLDRQFFGRDISVPAILDAGVPILYSGIMSCGVAYTLQIVGQKDVHPTLASMIMSLESVTSVIAGFLILSQKLTVDELIGCGLMFAAIILAQIPVGKRKPAEEIQI